MPIEEPHSLSILKVMLVIWEVSSITCWEPNLMWPSVWSRSISLKDIATVQAIEQTRMQGIAGRIKHKLKTISTATPKFPPILLTTRRPSIKTSMHLSKNIRQIQTPLQRIRISSTSHTRLLEMTSLIHFCHKITTHFNLKSKSSKKLKIRANLSAIVHCSKNINRVNWIRRT